MDDFWSGFFFGITFVYLLNWFMRKLIVWLVLRLASKEIAKMKAQEEAILLKVENHNGMLYCYRKDNDEFVGQGKSLEELADIFKRKYPSQDGRILKEDAEGLI